MSAISTWCILGDYCSDGLTACPTTRFDRLHEWLRTDGLPHDKPITDLFREWTERFAYTPIEVGLKRNEAETDRFILNLEEILDKYPEAMHDKALITLVLRFIELIMHAFMHTKRGFE
jgi:hypothetical protein